MEMLAKYIVKDGLDIEALNPEMTHLIDLNLRLS
jgi:hypothetical protein